MSMGFDNKEELASEGYPFPPLLSQAIPHLGGSTRLYSTTMNSWDEYGNSYDGLGNEDMLYPPASNGQRYLDRPKSTPFPPVFPKDEGFSYSSTYDNALGTDHDLYGQQPPSSRHLSSGFPVLSSPLLYSDPPTVPSSYVPLRDPSPQFPPRPSLSSSYALPQSFHDEDTRVTHPILPPRAPASQFRNSFSPSYSSVPSAPSAPRPRVYVKPVPASEQGDNRHPDAMDNSSDYYYPRKHRDRDDRRDRRDDRRDDPRDDRRYDRRDRRDRRHDRRRAYNDVRTNNVSEEVDLAKLERGEDKRSVVMIRNLPNRCTVEGFLRVMDMIVPGGCGGGS